MKLKAPHPPKWADKLLDWYCSAEYANEIRGDLLELFDRWVREKGGRSARLLYVLNAVLFIRAYNSRFRKTQTQTNQMTMFSHYLKMAGRNMTRQKTYTLANIAGLAIGIAVSLMIFLHVDKELSYEKSYPKHENIYRLAGASEWAKSSPTLGSEFKAKLPEVKEICRFASHSSNLKVISVGDQFFGVDDVYVADQSAIDIFDYKFVHGSKEDALSRPLTAVITQSLAGRIFGEKDPVGQVFELDEGDKFEITGVIHDLPENSHIKAEVLLSMPTLQSYVEDAWWNSKGWMVMYTYVLFDSEEEAKSAQSKLVDFQIQYHNVPEERIQEFMGQADFYELMPITEIHLKSDKIQEMGSNSNIVYVYIFISLAVFILIIACVNFINIFVTLSIRRIKEIGMRKVMGARKSQLMQQFLGEAFLTTIISAVVALAICMLALPYYNSLAEIVIGPLEILQFKYLAFLGGVVLLVGLLAGFYPAFLVSGFGVTKALSAKKDARAGVSAFRKSLIIFQFVLSLFIIICTVAVSLQMDYVQEKDLGYATEHVVAIKAYGKLKEELVLKRESIFSRMKENPAVQEVSLASNLMGDQLSVESMRLASMSPDGDYPSVNVLRVDENFLKALDIELVAGRGFRNKVDTGSVFIINEKLAELWGHENPVGEMAVLETRDETGPIVGVIRDINFYSLHRGMEPMVINYKPWWTNFLLVKINAENVPETLASLEATVKDISPSSIFHYRFLDDRINELYKNEMGMHKIFRVFAVLAIIISCIGLLGLAAIEVQRRTKEIGIRKVLGASSSGILTLLSRQFVLMVALAIAVTVPLSYYAINAWLANFEYHIEPGIFLFLLPSLVFVVMSFAMVCLQAFRAATSNPSESLRYE